MSKAKSIPTELAWLNMNYILSEIWSKSESFSHEAHFSCLLDLAIEQSKKYTNKTCLIEQESDFEGNMVGIWLIFAWSSFFMLIRFGFRVRQTVYQQNLPEWTKIRFWAKFGQNLTYFCMNPVSMLQCIKMQPFLGQQKVHLWNLAYLKWTWVQAKYSQNLTLFLHEAHLSFFIDLAIYKGKKDINRICLIEHELNSQ